MEGLAEERDEWFYVPVLGEVRSVNHGLLAEVIVNGDEDDNGLLMSAAPDLLEALQDFMSASSGNTQSCGHDFECICRFDKAKVAIAKALGK